jgi:hypothetical protein
VSRLADSSYLRRGIWPANFRVVDYYRPIF